MIPLEPESTYHIYNRANGNEKIFADDGNYFFFINKYKEYVSPFSDTFSYCLMPNHFHFLLRIKDEKQLNDFFQNKKKLQIRTIFSKVPNFGKAAASVNLEKLLSKQFSNFLVLIHKRLTSNRGEWEVCL